MIEAHLCRLFSSPGLGVFGPVFTTPDKFENAALLLRFGLSSTLIRHENNGRAFRKHSSNRRNLKTPAFRLRVDGKHLESRAFQKRCVMILISTESCVFPDQVFLKYKSKTTGEVIVASGVVWTETFDAFSE